MVFIDCISFTVIEHSVPMQLIMSDNILKEHIKGAITGTDLCSYNHSHSVEL